MYIVITRFKSPFFHCYLCHGYCSFKYSAHISHKYNTSFLKYIKYIQFIPRKTLIESIKLYATSNCILINFITIKLLELKGDGFNGRE